MQKMHDALAGNKRARAEGEREIRYSMDMLLLSSRATVDEPLTSIGHAERE